MNKQVKDYVKAIVEQVPEDWLRLTTHRLDIYNEERAKVEFTEKLEALYQANESKKGVLAQLPTAYDYIRLGHPLSSVLEWALGKLNHLRAERVIAFSSQTMPLLAVLRTNLLAGKNTRINYRQALPQAFDADKLRAVYGYQFELKPVAGPEEVEPFNGSNIYLSAEDELTPLSQNDHIDFYLSTLGKLGSIIYITGGEWETYVSAVQHVRRRESIAMTPANCYEALGRIANKSWQSDDGDYEANKARVLETIAAITGTETPAALGSCGLSVQYAIMMGLIDEALQQHPGKDIKFLVPPNCYGGTNDQARRVAAAHPKVEVLDLPVDGDNDMVQSIERVLTQVAAMDAVPYIIAEIPTNPRVEVPDLEALRAALSKERQTAQGDKAIAPVFILDQTFCPNVQFLSEAGILAQVRTLSYVSGSKFPSGGKATAGYVVANQMAAELMPQIANHLQLCDNEATELQVAILAEQLPSMNERIAEAYRNTREFVKYIKKTLPAAKINFVSEALAKQGFTPSVFSLDLPTEGNTPAEREAYKRQLNQRLIDMMISEIPEESKYCVSYGQLKGCYWTIPATSTQGTTKEEDKDYIARVSVSPDLDLEKHKAVFAAFCETL